VGANSVICEPPCESSSATGSDGEVAQAAAFDPFVVLFSQHGADQTDDGRAVGEDADDVGAR